MKVPIIVPVYNVESYLTQCIESLLIQTSIEYEIILVDDGSTDGSSSICDAYSANYNNVHAYHKVNGGLSSARNYGLDKSTGEWVVFVDSDDFVEFNLIKQPEIIRLLESVSNDDCKIFVILWRNPL